MVDINKKWVEEDSRVFSVYPGTPNHGSAALMDEDTWLELAQFFRDDLRWLLSLEHHKFWSHMIYSEKVHPLLVSFLKEFPPHHSKDRLFVKEEMKNAFKEIEHLVFLIFLRLSTEEESKGCYVKNLGEILYNNYLFTVPVILDICLIYGASNNELVRRMINNVVRLAPDFLGDFQEIAPHFFQVLRTVRGKFWVEHLPKLRERGEVAPPEVRDLALYLHDSVATVQLFLELYPKGCQIFSQGDLINEIVSFYSNVLPEMHNCWRKKKQEGESLPIGEVIEDTRVDLLKMVKTMFDFVSNDSSKRREDTVDEYLTLMLELLPEPTFLTDYNRLYPIENEIVSMTKTCPHVDTMKVDHILDGVALAEREMRKEEEEEQERRLRQEEPEMKGVKLNSLITEVKDILPHLEDAFIRDCLKRYDYNTERVIAAVLENSVPVESKKEAPERTESESLVEFKGKHKSKHKNLNELLDDRGEIQEFKERYSQLAYLEDEDYDDEYDDTYDENIAMAMRDGDEAGRRPFVVPRVLRAEGDYEEEDEEEDEEEEEEQMARSRDAFVENPAERRERMAQRRAEQTRRDVVGRGRGQGQSREVQRNRDFKGAHKSSVANHNRKRQASRKMNRGMFPS